MPTSDFSKHTVWLIGNGRWGKNIARTLEELRVGYLRIGGHSQPLDTTAVFIATPLKTHASLALPFIASGFPVFIEKPLAYTRAEALSLVQTWWGSPKAPILCDFQHCFSTGFTAVLEELKARSPSRISFIATLGGPGPVRPDCHPLWDYGSHLVAMACQLGLKEALLNAHLEFDPKTKIWTIYGDPSSPHQVELSISNALDTKTRRAHIAFDADIVGNYSEPIWLVHREYGPHAGNTERYDNEKDPPLMEVIEKFLTVCTEHKSVLGSAFDSRFGLSLPIDVDTILRRLSGP